MVVLPKFLILGKWEICLPNFMIRFETIKTAEIFLAVFVGKYYFDDLILFDLA